MRGIQENRGPTENNLLGQQTTVTMVHSATFQANESLKIQSYLFQHLFSKHEINNDGSSSVYECAYCKAGQTIIIQNLGNFQN
jgi:hypothetical protein